METKRILAEHRVLRGGTMIRVRGHSRVSGGEVLWRGLGYEAAWRALRRMIDRREIPFESCQEALDNGVYLIDPPNPAPPQPPPWKSKPSDEG